MVYQTRLGDKKYEVEVLSCDCRLDAANMVKLKTRINSLIKRNQKRVLLDLSRTRQVDLAGVGILMERVKTLRSLQGDVKVCNIRRQVSDTFRMIGISRLIESYASREEALQSFAAQ